MIKTSRQLKALARNLTKGDSIQAQIIMRNYVMERFLERISLSKYRNNFILKGGMLVSAMVGLDTRSMMDIDTTIKNIPLSVENARKMIEEIIAIPIDDGMAFSIKSVSEIMDEAEYSGVRANLEATLETMRTPLKVDISTGDVITPREVSYTFKLMFEERTISILAYNLETVLAERMETVIARGVANTRMRDYYDLYVLQSEYTHTIDMEQFMQLHSEERMQLLFTTHESSIMDQSIFRRDEIWFIERNAENASEIYSLDRFKERYDKVLSKAYLEGRYGAIPVFSTFEFREEE